MQSPSLHKKLYSLTTSLSTGTVGPTHGSHGHDSSSQHNFVNVEFDDGDSGRIHVDDIRLLPQNYPVTGERSLQGAIRTVNIWHLSVMSFVHSVSQGNCW